jgi:endonuclease-3 related protein
MTIPALYDYLLAKYGKQHWWPSKTSDPWEIIAGAILTQNTAWTNVERALEQMSKERLTTPAAILGASDEDLQKAIRSAGFFHQKSAYLKAAAEFCLRNAGQYARPCGREELAARRKALLAVKGVGRETADDILLYAFRLPVFIIDAYTRRMAEKFLGLNPKLPYDEMQRVFMEALPESVPLYGEYHALIVRHCKAERGVPMEGDWSSHRPCHLDGATIQ